MVIRTLVSAAILFSSLICHSQASDVDRLTTLITTSQDDTIKVTLLNELVASLRDGDINLAFMYAQQANKLSASLKHRRGNALALENLSWLSYRRGHLAASFQQATEALKLNQELADNAAIARCLNSIATIYYERRQFDAALHHHKRALAAARAAHDASGEAQSLNSVGATYLCLNIPDSAKIYATQGLTLSRNAGNAYLEGYAHRILGDIELKKSNFDAALQKFSKTVEIAKQIDNKFLEVSTLHRLGKVYLLKSKPSYALQPLLKNIEMAKRFGYNEELACALRLTASVYALLKDVDNAFEYQTAYMKLHDSLFEQRNNEQLTSMQERFESQLNQAEIEILKKDTQLKQQEINSQQLWMYFTIGLLMLTAVLAFVLSYSNWAKQKANKILGIKNLEIQEQAIQLTNLNITKDKLFSIISHDVRGPLASLRGLVNIICKGELTHAEFVANSVRLRQNLDTVQDDLDNLLYWAQTQLNGLLVNPEKINLHALIDDKIRLFNDVAERKELSIISEVSRDLTAFADRNHLGLIIRNLLANAIKFNRRGGVIRISERIAGSTIEISVADTGVGIDPGDLKKLFNAQTHFSNLGTDQEKGAGIGLLLTKEFIEKNGGMIRVSSEPGKGSTFTFTTRLVVPQEVVAQEHELSTIER